MLRLFLFSLATAVLCAAGPAPLDKAAMETYVRHLFVVGPQVKVQVLDPVPSDLPGFSKISVRMSSGQSSQEMAFYVTADGKKLMQANVWEMGKNPFKTQLDKLKTESQPNFGTPGATVVLVLFSDYQCPYCKVEGEMLRQNLLSAYPKQVRVYFKDFPIETIHDWARPAAVAGRCVFQQKPEQYWSYHDWIYGHQGEITKTNFRDKAMEWANKSQQVDALQFGRCIDTNSTAADVDKNVAEAKALGVDRTPTLFINGRMINERLDWPTLRAIIDNEIEYQKTARNAGEDCGCEVKLDLPVLSKPAAPGVKR